MTDTVVRRAVVITASDGVSSGVREDHSGPAVARALAAAGFTVDGTEVVPDERRLLAERLRTHADAGVDVVTVTGGTGFAARDITPEATRDVLEREAPGLAEAMRATGRAHTPMADLSRGVCGIRGRTLILNLPGSPRGALESLDAVIGLLPHALQLLGGDTAHGSGDTPPPPTPPDDPTPAAG